MKHLSNGRHLVVVRISDSNAMRELEKKVKETAESHRSIPGADQLANLGSLPLREPDRVNGRAFNGPGFRAVVFRIPGTQTHALLALGSATKINLGDDDNAFVRIMADTLTDKPVESIWVADFARLLRSIDYLSDTWKAVRNHCRYVHHGGAVIDVTGPTAEIQFLFEALSAAADARSVVKRTTIGKMRTYVQGACPLAAASVPFGFRRLPDRSIGLDSDNSPTAVREIVTVLGDPDLTDAERLRRVAAAGGVSKFRAGRRCTPIPVDKLRNPGDVVARWYGLLDTWREGKWIVQYDLPGILNQVAFDLPVKIDDRYGTRVWRMEFQLPMPAEGFATRDAFEAAEELRDRRQARSTPTGGAAGGLVRKPFCGLPSWIEDEYEHALLSRGPKLYEFRRRPAKRTAELDGGDADARTHRGWGRRPNMDGELVALVSAAELHARVPEAVAEALTRGLQMTTITDAVLQSDDTDAMAEGLREQLSDLRRRARNARRSANSATTEQERKDFQHDMRQANDQAAVLEADLIRLARSGNGTIPVDADELAIALASIVSEPDHVPGPIADAYRTILHGFRLRRVTDSTLEFQTHIRVPLVGGTLTLGPVRGTVPAGTSRSVARLRTSALRHRAGEAAALVMAEGADMKAAAAELQIVTNRRVAQTVRDHLKSLGLAARAASLLVAQGTRAARAVTWERLHGRPLPATVSRPLAAHLSGVYLDADCPGLNPRRRVVERGIRRVLDELERHGGWVPDSARAATAKAAGISPVTLDYLATGRKRQGRFDPPVLMEVDGGFGLLPCPHSDCTGWATVVCTLPEVTSLVLCGRCRRMPDLKLGAIVFTDEYLAGAAA